MKKIIIYFIFLIVFSISIVKGATYEDVKFKYYDNIYSNRAKGLVNRYDRLTIINVNGKNAYSISPHYSLAINNYNEFSFLLDQYSKEQLEYFAKLSYFGYGYENRNNIEYYMAVQELIWKEISKEAVYWTSMPNDRSYLINIDKYKNEVLESINDYQIKPSFENIEISGYYGQIIKYTDKNNVLNEFEIEYNGKNKIWIEDDNLFIEILSDQDEIIKFVKKSHSGKNAIYSAVSDRQRLAVFNINEEININLKVQAAKHDYTKLKIINIDENNKQINNFSTFKIYDYDFNGYLNDETFSIMGEYTNNFYIKKGKYRLENIEVPTDYNYIDSDFEIDENDLTINNIFTTKKCFFKIYSKKIKSNFSALSANEIYKVYANESIYDLYGNILYNENDFVEEIITNEKGYAETSLLPFGSYLFKNKNTFIEKINLTDEINYKEIHDYIYEEIINEPIFEEKINNDIVNDTIQINSINNKEQLKENNKNIYEQQYKVDNNQNLLKNNPNYINQETYSNKYVYIFILLIIILIIIYVLKKLDK